MRKCHWIAARMLCLEGTPNPDNLHPAIAECLSEIDDLVRRDGGDIRSRQIVAMFIFAWRNANPGVIPYGERVSNGNSGTKA